MARRSGGIVAQTISGGLAIFVIGGWWLSNGGPDGGFQGCVDDSIGVVTAVANQGKHAWDSLGNQFNSDSNASTPSPITTTTSPAEASR
ncbi:hypothetical protein GS504_01705 [Rhodococcus hoagii]|nr:hypothetical protein [Prescottella equi]NKS71614.1 hypothetical protein [Prescottella equi]